MSESERSASNTRIVKAISWNLVAAGASQIAGLMRVAITARVLTPHDFGLFAMTMVVYGGLAVFSDVGLRPAFIAHHYASDAERDEWLDTVWSAEVVLKIGLALLTMAVAYPAALYFREPRVTALTIVIGFSPLIRSLSNPALLVLEKQIQFRKVALYEMGAGIGSALITAVAAVLMRSVWALAVGHVVGAVLATAITYWVQPGRPRFRLLQTPLRAALKFGRPMLVLSVLNFLAGRFDSLVIARQIGAVALGTYVIATRLVEIPVGLISYEVGRVLLPYYAEANGRGSEAMAESFVTSMTYLLWTVMAIYVPIFCYPDLIVRWIFGPGWEAAVVPARILAISGLLRAGTRALGTALQAVRAPELDARSMALEVVVLIVAVMLTVPTWGALGAAWSVVLSFAVGFVLRLWFTATRVRPPLRSSLGRFVKPVAAAAGAIAIAELAQAAAHLALLGIVTFGVTLALFAWALEPQIRDLIGRLDPRRSISR